MENQILSDSIAQLASLCTNAELSTIDFNDNAIKLVSLAKSHESETKGLVKAFFRDYLTLTHDIFVLIQGAIYKNYHIKEHIKYKHERESPKKTGYESRFYSNSKFLSLCSVDGLRFYASTLKRNSTEVIFFACLKYNFYSELTLH